jgi:hypothetical protein
MFRIRSCCSVYTIVKLFSTLQLGFLLFLQEINLSQGTYALFGVLAHKISGSKQSVNDYRRG